MKFKDRDVHLMDSRVFRQVRQSVQMVFQNPEACLNPHMRVRALIDEALSIKHSSVSFSLLKDTIDRVRLAEDRLECLPSELSGGEKRKVTLARALALEPEFIVADEPVSGLDAITAAQIMNLLKGLGKMGVSFLHISHDLRMIKFLCSRIMVMYGGRIVEEAPVGVEMVHPYSHLLFASAFRKRMEKSTLRLSHTTDSNVGCNFRTNCIRYLTERNACCEKEIPVLRELENGHFVACHLL